VLAEAAAGSGGTGAEVVLTGESGALRVSSSKACGAYFANMPSYKALIANRTRIPGKNQFLENRMYKPINHIAA
jgi:hypothetical protein